MAVALGLSACAVSATLFGSMFVPVRKYDAGDGFFAQWIMSMAILTVGFIVFCIQGFPGFYPLAMIGGVCWTLGNVMAIPIINRLSMAIGILIWNTMNCLTGWASGRFGLFGTTARPPKSDFLNFAGLACVLLGGVLFAQLQGEPREEKDKKNSPNRTTIRMKDIEEEEKQALNASPEKASDTVIGSDEVSPEVEYKKVVPANSKYFGPKIQAYVMALLSGTLYGVTFSPVNYMIASAILNNPLVEDNHDTKFTTHPVNGLDYVFSHYFGIFLTATALFLIYALVKKNRPCLNPEIAVPGYLSGLFWGVAQSSFFVANDNLSQTVTFPIITMLPGCIAAAWSILYFREIKGQRNFTILAVAITITLFGAAMVGISKDFSFSDLSSSSLDD